MNQMILMTTKYVTQDKKIPTMKALLVTDGILSASADDFILKDLVPDAPFYQLTGKTMIPGFIDIYGDFLGRAKEIAKANEIGLNEAIAVLCKYYAENGFTTAVQKNASAADLEILQAAGQSGFLNIDVAVYLEEAASSVLPEQMPMDNEYNNHVRLAGVSVYVDDMVNASALLPMIKSHITKHQQIAFTANTKAAIQTCLDAYKSALCEVNGTKTDEDGNEKPKIFEDLRPLIIGCRDLSNDQLTLLQSLGFVPCFDHDMLFANGTPAAASYPLRDAVRRGLAFCITHDGTSFPSAVASMHLAANRASETGVVGEDYTINADQGLMAQTLFCAYAIFEDLYKGSLTLTKTADLTVLSDDPLETSDSSLQNNNICMTVKNGEVVYKNENI